MGEDGHPLESALGLLGNAAQAAGLSDQEARATIRSAYRTTSQLGRATTARPAIGAQAVAL